jgi:GNAT superfamily N-acetyltransferase
MDNLVYTREMNLSSDEFIDVLKRSTLAVRRPVDNPHIISSMLDRADIIITARENGKLVGVARSLSDFAYCTYLSDLAVDEAYQKKGIGKELIRITKEVSGTATVILIAAPAAEKYYPKIGMTQREHCYVLKNSADLID